jgi:hypothetical protein
MPTREVPPPEPTHYCDWDEPGRDRVRALCGVRIRRIEHSNEPTCPQCLAGLEYRRDMAAPC